MTEQRTGLDAVLPIVPEAGKNEWVLDGWEPRIEAQDVRVVLILEGLYRTRPLAANSLLSALRNFEKANPALLFKKSDGGITYKKKLRISFNYAPNLGMKRSFKSAYDNIRIEVVGAGTPTPDNIGAYA